MKIKTLEAESPERIDLLCNTFEDTHNVKATQSHIDYDKGIYSYILFYIEDK